MNGLRNKIWLRKSAGSVHFYFSIPLSRHFGTFTNYGSGTTILDQGREWAMVGE